MIKFFLIALLVTANSQEALYNVKAETANLESCVVREVRESQASGYEADESEVLEFCLNEDEN